MIKLAFIIPIYNVNKYLDECLSSIAKINFEKEVILIDDCGGQDPSEIISKFTSLNKDFKVIKNKINLGIGFSRNEGLNNVSKDVTHIIFVDSDDYINSDEFNILEIKKNNSYCWKNTFQITQKNFFSIDEKVSSVLEYNKRFFQFTAWGWIWSIKHIKNIRFKSRTYEDATFVADVIESISENEYKWIERDSFYIYRKRKSSTTNGGKAIEKLNSWAKQLDDIHHILIQNCEKAKVIYKHFLEAYFKLSRKARKKSHFLKLH